MTKPKIENIPIEHDSFLNEIPDFDGFIHANDDLLNFPLSISQLAKAAQTTVHTVRNYLIEDLLHCSEQTKAGYGLYDLCALKRLRFIRSARAAGLLIVDIRPLLLAINEDQHSIPANILTQLYTKIQHKRIFLEHVRKQIEEIDQLVQV
ncbi:MerR family transcriptional regulator, mercuric resistance operon regulatory protein [Colwellia chukchiensis]|uniref:MerR family transcriptional regulator, mercuric resistance operon regulatory protein n=1 Tax=Colwellia chukchiensis TaxID=641665 RepID=A0A1H7I3Q4_9GAMM|nr:MerR family transcriptional regulator [Colwellia chukchiensis]SEK56472.1 MerR family transcriptional regulator, mercuric resistance operon regulatory protein [Colwellia chukchiensis]